MALASYSDLQAAIASEMDRTDINSFVPDFILQAEALFNHGADGIPALRCREMETIATLTPATGVVTLPADYLRHIRLVEAGSRSWPLDYVTPDAGDRLYPSRPGGISRHFTIIGNDLRLYPATDNDVELTYYAAIPALSDLNPTNWLLKKSPGLYLRATLMAGYEFVHDAGRMAAQAQMAQSLMAGLNHSDMVGKYARAGLQLRAAP